MLKNSIANIVTCTRLIGAILLLAFHPLDFDYMCLYTYCGISDVLDGFLARKLKIQSKLGSKLDSISDLIFYTIMMIQVLPILHEVLNHTIFIYIYLVLGIRICCYIFVFVRDHKFASEHFILNKMTGFLMFCIPYFIKKDFFLYYALLVCTQALVAAIHEFYYHLIHKS